MSQAEFLDAIRFAVVIVVLLGAFWLAEKML